LLTCPPPRQCTGDRPSCTACIKHGSECLYASATRSETNAQALKRRYEESLDESGVYRDLFGFLRTLPEAQATEVLHRVRAGASADTILRQIQDGDLLLQLALVPETRLRYVFPYRKEMPLAIRKSQNAYLDSVLYEVIYVADEALSRQDGRESSADHQEQLTELRDRYFPAYLRPYHAAKHVDRRLSSVDVTRWTTVITDNDLFVALLSSYFVHEYQSIPAFHSGIFLQALADHDELFCSPLLVNALLAEACVRSPNNVAFATP
jgi:hypothetical protein